MEKNLFSNGELIQFHKWKAKWRKKGSWKERLKTSVASMICQESVGAERAPSGPEQHRSSILCLPRCVHCWGDSKFSEVTAPFFPPFTGNSTFLPQSFISQPQESPLPNSSYLSYNSPATTAALRESEHLFAHTIHVLKVLTPRCRHQEVDLVGDWAMNVALS